MKNGAMGEKKYKYNNYKNDTWPTKLKKNYDRAKNQLSSVTSS